MKSRESRHSKNCWSVEKLLLGKQLGRTESASLQQRFAANEFETVALDSNRVLGRFGK